MRTPCDINRSQPVEMRTGTDDFVEHTARAAEMSVTSDNLRLS